MDQAGNIRIPIKFNITKRDKQMWCATWQGNRKYPALSKTHSCKNKTKPPKLNLIDPLVWGSSNYDLPGKSSPPPDFTNKVLLRLSHIHLFTYCLWLLSQHNGRFETIWTAKTQIFIIWTFREKFHQPLYYIEALVQQETWRTEEHAKPTPWGMRSAKPKVWNGLRTNDPVPPINSGKKTKSTWQNWCRFPEACKTYQPTREMGIMNGYLTILRN